MYIKKNGCISTCRNLIVTSVCKLQLKNSDNQLK